MKMPVIIFTRNYLPAEEEYGVFAKAGSTEISNGLCWLAAVTREKRYKTEIVDGHILKLSNKELAAVLVNKSPRYIGITSNTINILYASELAKEIKCLNSKIKIILGGPHITALPRETMKTFKEFDIGVLREGELTIVELIQTLENRKSLAKVKGIVYRTKCKLKINKPRGFIKDLDSLPLPAWDLLPDIKKFYNPPSMSLHRGKSALIITSRGCPNQCAFCDRSVFGNLCRAHSSTYVLRMIRELRTKYGITHFRINDDNFILFKKRLVEICTAIIRENLDITWSCFARVDSISPEMLNLMKEAGCWQVSFGIESGEPKILAIEKKKISLEQIETAVKLARKAGIRVVGFNIFGHPLETTESMQKTIDFNKKIKVEDFHVHYMVPFPGTELYKTAEKYGVLDRDWKKMGMFNEPCFIPYGLTKNQLIKYHKKAFWQFYLQPRVIFSYFKAIQTFKDFGYFIGCAYSVIMQLFFKKS